MEFIYLVCRVPGGRRFRSLLLCPLSVERYNFLFCVIPPETFCKDTRESISDIAKACTPASDATACNSAWMKFFGIADMLPQESE